MVYLQPFDKIRIAELTVCGQTSYSLAANQGDDSEASLRILTDHETIMA